MGPDQVPFLTKLLIRGAVPGPSKGGAVRAGMGLRGLEQMHPLRHNEYLKMRILCVDFWLEME